MEGHEIERKTAWVPANNYCVHITAHNLKIVSAHFPGVRMLRKCFIPFVGTIYSKKHNGPKSRVRRRSFPGSKAQWHHGPFGVYMSYNYELRMMNLSMSTKITTNTETAMLSFRSLKYTTQ